VKKGSRKQRKSKKVKGGSELSPARLEAPMAN